MHILFQAPTTSQLDHFTFITFKIEMKTLVNHISNCLIA